MSASQGDIMPVASLSPPVLSHYVSENPESAYFAHAYKEKLWLVAEVVTVVAFTGAATGAVVFTGLYAAAYVPVAIVGSLCGIQLSMPLYLKVHNIKDAHKQLARVQKGVAEEFKKLNALSPENYRKCFSLRGLNSGNIEGFDKLKNGYEDLKPILARCLYWKNQKPLLLDEVEKLICIATRERDPRIRYEYRKCAYEFRDEAKRSTIREAFMHAILRKPHYQGELSNICDFYELSFDERVRGERFGDPETNLGIIFKAPGKNQITRDQLSNMHAVDLKSRFLEVMV